MKRGYAIEFTETEQVLLMILHSQRIVPYEMLHKEGRSQYWVNKQIANLRQKGLTIYTLPGRGYQLV